MLRVENLHAYYDKSHILHGLNFDIKSGEILALLGRNGVGRSTTLKTIMGMLRAEGSIRFRGHEILGLPSFKIAQLGIGYVPENREIFAELTVEQNLLLGQKSGATDQPHWQLDEMYELFPILKERSHTKAGVLSGGEQQMLSLSRSLLGNPDLLLIDEPTEGLAPKIIELLREFFIKIKQRGIAILLVEQKLNLALQVADRFLIMGHGQTVFEGDQQALLANEAIRQEWLEV
ncbi:ABC transporter ATP-binding protein [Undibacterium amnicola]|uniref:ABC transporter ATP-binding protein n=1 Tax=Undibacterium amnicola TaxID=1834038 RepID=A0ABR6XM23_9BURK|nr:ABC transporter ATP-binding protein [Undibacterium amnicola]MBC3830567.1 ABC transporter ATP-binding protein [Undibacterium amnicola]